MAVYDLDLFYARRFADVMNQKENIPFAVMAFTSLERLRQYAGGHSIEILLVSSQVNMDEICDLGIGQVITLTEGEKKEGIRTILLCTISVQFRYYQGGDGLLQRRR
mgnify:CR=1 FL=1